jgi:arsenate reductase
VTDHKPSILFLCIHNAGRSQMAAAFARQLGGERVVVHSAVLTRASGSTRPS